MNTFLQCAHTRRPPIAGKPATSRVTVVFFDCESRAMEGLRRLEELLRDRRLTTRAHALVLKDAKGAVRVRRSSGPGPEATTLGSLVGGLVGVHAGPFGLLVGVCAGALLGAAVDLSWVGIDDDSIDRVSRALSPGEAAIVAEFDTPDESRPQALAETLHARRIRDTTTPSNCERSK